MHNLQTEYPMLFKASLKKFKNKHVTKYMQFELNHKQTKQTLLNMTI